MLQNKELDGILICTPDHWHAKPAIEASQAGKDVYLEEPTSLTIAEGRAMSDAIMRTGRIFQRSRGVQWDRRQCRGQA